MRARYRRSRYSIFDAEVKVWSGREFARVSAGSDLLAPLDVALGDGRVEVGVETDVVAPSQCSDCAEFKIASDL